MGTTATTILSPTSSPGTEGATTTAAATTSIQRSKSTPNTLATANMFFLIYYFKELNGAAINKNYINVKILMGAQ